MSRSLNADKQGRGGRKGGDRSGGKRTDRAYYGRSDERKRNDSRSSDRRGDRRNDGRRYEKDPDSRSGSRNDDRRVRSYGKNSGRTGGKTEFRKSEERSDKRQGRSFADRRSSGRGSETVRSGRGTAANGRSSNGKQKKTVLKNSFIRADVIDYDNDLFEGFADDRTQENENIIFGRNPVMEAVRSGRNIEKILIADKAEGSVHKIAGKARDRNIRVQYTGRNVLDRVAGGAMHQGVIAYVSDFEYAEVEDILGIAEERGEDPFIIVLDGIEDPHNLGAIIRTADAAGAHGVIIPMRRAVAVTPAVERAAAGAVEYMAVARVANISKTIGMLKKKGIWVISADMDGECLWDSEMSGPAAIIIGSEGKGVSRLVKESCDRVVSLPMNGGVNSLNASNAAALLMYEVVRQRRM